ncbi:MAG: efflux RND transporter permease subunit [bacterium]|nr:efflux RND transporter permease subunit [bacterium]
MSLTRFAISRPVITAMLFAALAIFGTIAYFQLGRSSNPPNTTFPVVVVAAGYPGASPQDMEKLIVKPIEDQLDGIDNLDQVSATAQEGTASVVVQFKLGTNLDLAAVDVQRRVDTARIYMPSDLNPPFVYKNGATEPLLDLAVSSNSLSEAQLADIANNQLEPLLKQIPNVQTVDIFGAADREFHVEPDPNRLVGVNATLQDVFNSVAANNQKLPGGILHSPTQEATVSVNADLQNVADISGIPLVVPGGANRYMNVGSVAKVYDSHVEMRTISSYNGLPRLYVSLGRNINADEITSTKIAREKLKSIEAQFPQLQFHEIDAPADYTAKSLAGVGQSLIEGIFLTAIVMLLFLHAWRNAVVVLVAIPSSILSTFILMKAFGFHIDSMSMMGLSLIIGILVDDSIVVLENITRHRDLGEDPTSAAINGRNEIGSAAVAITMVDVVVFLPVAFLPGIVGAYLKEFGAVVVIATLFSLFVSFTLTPLLAAKWSVRERSEAKPAWLLALDDRRVDLAFVLVGALLFVAGHLTGWLWLKAFGIFAIAVLVLNAFVHRYEWLLEQYRQKLLPFALEHGSFVVFTCTVLLLNALAVVGGGQNAVGLDAAILILLAVTYGAAWIVRRRRGPGRGFRSLGSHRPLAVATFVMPVLLALAMYPLNVNFDFVPQTQTGHINMNVTYPAGTPIDTTNAGVMRLAHAILKIQGIKDVSTTVGRKPSGWGSSIGGNYAQLGADMQDNLRGQTNDTIPKIRKLAYLVPGASFQVAGDSGSGSGNAIFYSLSGPEDEIGPAAEKVAQILRSTPGSVNVQTSAENGAPRLNVDIDRARCAVLGISPADAAEVARLAVSGGVATKVRSANGLVDVRVQFPYDARNSVDQLKDVRVRSATGVLVPLGSIATFTWMKAPTKVERLNRERVVNVLGDALPGYSLGQVTAPLEKKLKEPGFLPPGVGLTAQGDTQFMQETFANMGIALLTSFMLVYMLMVILYSSFVEPLIVMFSVPLAVIGALIFLAVMGKLQPEQGQSLNIISMLGIIMLFGLVAKNGILLVDYSNTLCKRGMRVREAVLQAATTRFRPIVMTTAAMIFGMLPLALGFAEGGEWRQAMGTVIIGGLLSSLVLTLFMVPMIYNTWMGALERRADRRAVKAELEGTAIPAHT